MRREQQYVLQDSQAAVALVSRGFREALQPSAAASGAHLHILGDAASSESSSQQERAHQVLQRELGSQQRDEQGALILFTSGTTGRPKGAAALLTFELLQAGGSAVCLPRSADSLPAPTACACLATVLVRLAAFSRQPIVQACCIRTAAWV